MVGGAAGHFRVRPGREPLSRDHDSEIAADWGHRFIPPTAEGSLGLTSEPPNVGIYRTQLAKAAAGFYGLGPDPES